MAFPIAAGYVSWRPAAVSSTKADEPQAQPAPKIQHMLTRPGHVCRLGRMASTVVEGARDLHRLDLEKVVLRTSARRRFQETLADLESKIARKTTVNERQPEADGAVELLYRASLS